jgi:mannosyltransferase OCH1-like enzyme
MAAKADLDAAIAAASARRAAGDAAGARAILAGLAAGGLAGLPPVTALGLNRRLHAALLRQAKAEGDRVARVGLQAHLVPPASALQAVVAVTDAQRRQMVAAAGWPVPHLLHQVWIGPRPVPATVDAWAGHAARHGWRHKLWREADLAAAGHDRGAVFAARTTARDWPGAVDAARYAILAAEGGVWLDADWFPGRADQALHDAIPMTGLATLAEDIPRLTGRGSLLLANSVIAAPPGHPALRHLLDVLPAVAEALPGAPAWWATGPLVFTLVARAGPVSVLAFDLVEPALPHSATLAEAEARAAQVRTRGGGLLIPWKPWG